MTTRSFQAIARNSSTTRFAGVMIAKSTGAAPDFTGLRPSGGVSAAIIEGERGIGCDRGRSIPGARIPVGIVDGVGSLRSGGGGWVAAPLENRLLGGPPPDPSPGIAPRRYRM